MSKDMSERMRKRIPEDMPEIVSEDMPERLSEDMLDRMSEDMPESMSEDHYPFLKRGVENCKLHFPMWRASKDVVTLTLRWPQKNNLQFRCSQKCKLLF